MDCFSSTKGESDQIVVGLVSGDLMIISRFGKIDKHISEAHKGSVTAVKWSKDGQTISSVGEDGAVKIWSRSGMLRTELMNLDQGIYSVDWSPTDDYIACGISKMIYLKPIQPGNRESHWKAHDGVVLKIDWNQINEWILTAGEDCRIKIFDSYGRNLYTSTQWDYAVTSISWARNGEYFAAGSFGVIKLCDKSGWTYSIQEVNKGSIMDLKWSPDSTLLACSTAQGEVVLGFITDKRLEWQNWEATITADNEIIVKNVLDDRDATLAFNERLINVSFMHDYIIAATLNICRIYNINVDQLLIA